MKRTVIVIGAGASGMVAAIHAARAGAHVMLLEHMDRVGKKILSTGNGRCNLTNLYQSPECYRCSRPDFPMSVINRFPVEKTLEFFEGLGIVIKSRDGYLYPNSDQAASVLEVLRMELDRLRIEPVCGCQITAIKKEKQFVISTSCGIYRADALILSTGSKAAPVTGSDGSGYALAQSLGHHIILPLPALVQLRCQEKHYKQLAGIRTEAQVTLYSGKTLLAEDCGELQLTDYGISGIPVFQVSRYAAVALSKKQPVKAQIDFLPKLTMEETEFLLKKRMTAMPEKTWEQWMTGLFHKKLAGVLLKLAAIRPEQSVSQAGERERKQLLKQIKTYETTVIAANPYENAQICCGGADTAEISPETLESKLIPGLYLTGELLDVDGICGGYNLQWAWSSGSLAGMDAGKGLL